MTSIAASALVPAPPRAVFAFLADTHNHWNLVDRRIRLLEIGADADGALHGMVMIRGPLGIRRWARTRVLSACEPASLGGIAEIGERTIANVRWDLDPAGSAGTHVALSATASSAGWADRLLLWAGGTVWMRCVFASTLRLLAQRLAAEQAAGALAHA